MVKDISLAEQGEKKLDWARQWMNVLAAIRERFEKEKPFKGIRIAMAVHLEKKTGVLVETLLSGGAEVAITGCNPLSTDDEVAAALAKKTPTFAWTGATVDEYYEFLNKVLDIKPHIIIDDGADLVALVHKERQDVLDNIIGGNEETTTGVIRLKNMERDGILKFPMINVNDAKNKHFFDNRYGTGQSSWEGIMRATNRLVAGSTVIVAGYGWVGRGIAMRARGLGAKVIVTEIDPIKALEAYYDGFIVTNMLDAIKKYKPDFIVTATGNTDVVRAEHFEAMNDGVILANAGHFDVEISVRDLKKIAKSKRELVPCVEEYTLPNGNRVYLLSKGRLVNLAQPCGQGHPIEVMDQSFAIQALSAEYLVKKGKDLEPKVYAVPEEIDRWVAEIRLQALGITIDKLTEEQKKYLASWEIGT
ncbi:MAG: adenosylhomocysteinase [Candidatus Asgardarchaeia archaeon]